MEASFWHERWELDQIGFHVNETNPLLVRHLDKLQLRLDLINKARLFLPLCGKTLDIYYLLNLGYQVVGVEFSELAIKELFRELDITPTIKKKINSLAIKLNIDIFVGDFFDLTHEDLGPIDAIYDRASLIALPEDLRQSYTKHLCEISDSIKQLLICVEYDQDKMDGPPFSIDADQVHQYYEDIYSLNCVERDEIIGGLKQKVKAYESAWILSPKN